MLHCLRCAARSHVCWPISCVHHREKTLVNVLIAFITGLTTGGLSCLAVQGGLLASSLAGQIEKDYQSFSSKSRKKNQSSKLQSKNRGQLARPILVFLAAKLLAYTLVGFLLGWLGQMFQLSPMTRAILQIGIGVFMLGSALRMLNVHPIFRYFAFEPPALLRRKLRKAAAAGADETSLSTPAFLGFLTVLIPCGVTQAMMAVALSTGDPLEGAALMFAFTLGTSPVFFAVAYFATQLGKKLEKHFMRFVAVVILMLAVVTIDSGLTLAGSPISLTRTVNSTFRYPEEVKAAPPVQELQVYDPFAAGPEPDEKENTLIEGPSDGSVVVVDVENYGYVPDVVHAKAGVPVQLILVTNKVRSCSRAFIIPALGVQQILDETGKFTVEIPAQEAGTKIPFSCSMGMYGGTIVFDQ
jgi:uncharacterized protein